MKTIMIVFALSLSVGSAYSQKLKEADVPAAVKESFKKNYPNAKVEKWEKEDGNYEAEYEIARIGMDKSNPKKEKIERSVVYTPAGELVQTEEEIKVADLPKAVADHVNKNMPGKKIKEASQITTATGVNEYEVEIDDVDYIFDGEGKLLKKEEDKEKDDKKKD